MHTGVPPPMMGAGGSPAHLVGDEMSSIAETTSRTGRRNFNLRAYLAGTAATAALIGAVVFAFASLGAYVAFNGLPVGGSEASSEPTSVSVGESAVKTAPARSQDTSRGVINGARQDSGSAQGGGSGTHGGANASTATAPTQPVAPTTPGPTDSSGPVNTTDGSNSNPSSGTSPQAGDPPSATIPVPHVSAPDAVGGTVGTVEQTLHDVGIDVPLTGQGSAVDQVSDSLLGDN
jgi:hypothetical protein